MVTPGEMRLFALDCAHWAEQTPNPSDRETILSEARRCMHAASA